MPVTTVELIRRGARQFPDRRAILYDGGSLTFRAVDELSNRFARAFAALGAAKGARIALLLNNGPYSIPIDFACAKAGLARVPLNSRLSLDEHDRMIKETQVETLVYGADLMDRAEALIVRNPHLHGIGLGTARPGDSELLAAAAPLAADDLALAVDPQDVILIAYTSGTTGQLKAVRHTQASYAAICANILANLIPVEPDDVMLHAASLIHASGTFVLPFWIRGAASAVLPGFSPNDYLAAITRWRATAINLVPTMLQMLLATPGIAEADVSSLRHIVYGASPMPEPVIHRAMELWGRRFVQYYGQTEAPLCISVLRPEDHRPERLGSCGQPAVEAEIRIIDPNGRDVAPGETGEIAVRAPFVMAGYFRAPDLDALTFLPGGWLRTRDVGRVDAEGYLYLVDRTSDMIITGGYNVYPREVEDVLLAHPAVQECAVVGLPDPVWVEAVTAFVVRRPGVGVTEGELMRFVHEKIAAYKAPKAVRFIEAIPKSPVGKVLRRALRDAQRKTD
jgi:acyl-CoA synthetase (AMP-forming)/AMP-acid ligase II